MLSSDSEAPADVASPSEDVGIPLFRQASFVWLWLGQVFSQMADKIFLVLMIALTSSRFQDHGESLSGWVSAIMVSSTIPAVLFGAVAGVFVDRWSKKVVLISSNLLRGSLVLSIPFLLWATHTSPEYAGIPIGFMALLGVTFGVSTLTQYFAPAEQALLPLVVTESQLLKANSLCTATMMGAMIMGFALGEPILALADQAGHQWLAGADYGSSLVVGGAYLISALALTAVHPQSESHLDDETWVDVWQDLRIGFDYLRHTPLVRSALVQLISLYCVIAALAVLAVQLAEVLPVLKATQFGLLLSVAGLGLGLGAFFIGHVGSPWPRRVVSLWGCVGMAVALTLLAGSVHSLGWSLVLITLTGFFGAWVGVPMQTLIQEETPVDLRGKVFGLVNNFTNVALSVPLVLAGVAETLFGLAPVYLTLGILIALMGLLSYRMVTPEQA
ncbi:MAG: MFS transporter [Synechococcales cyanobacterium]